MVDRVPKQAHFGEKLSHRGALAAKRRVATRQLTRFAGPGGLESAS